MIESVRYNKTIRDIDFGNLTDSSLKVLTDYINGEHCLANISFGEGFLLISINKKFNLCKDVNETWKEQTKDGFILALRKNQFNKKLLSINVYCEDVWTHSK